MNRLVEENADSVAFGEEGLNGAVGTDPARPAKPRSRSEPPQHHSAREPNDVWHVNLTVVSTGLGMWVPWFPLALRQSWPFCWRVGVVVDGFSRRIVGYAVFDRQPTSQQVRDMLDEAIENSGRPSNVVCDRGPQFDCHGFRAWAEALGVALRHGAIGQHGSQAVVERVIGTLKREGLGRILVPYRIEHVRREIALLVGWYNEHRPHQSLDGATPDEVYEVQRPANRNTRIEPRPNWPRPSPCAAPRTLVDGQPGDECVLVVEFVEGRRHLPIVTLRRARLPARGRQSVNPALGIRAYTSGLSKTSRRDVARWVPPYWIRCTTGYSRLAGPPHWAGAGTHSDKDFKVLVGCYTSLQGSQSADRGILKPPLPSIATPIVNGTGSRTRHP